MIKKGDVRLLFSPCTSPFKDMYVSFEGGVQPAN